MDIPRERVAQLRDELQRRAERLAADLNATQGAIQACDLLLSDPEPPEPLKEPD